MTISNFSSFFTCSSFPICLPSIRSHNLILYRRAGSSTFISEPYYREYFAGGDGGQGYAPSRTIYGDAAEGPPTQSPYEGRYAPHAKSTPVYTKTVTAAGLTVDLPSPDSGIGADAITPRDQNNIQQVNSLFALYYYCFFVFFLVCC